MKIAVVIPCFRVRAQIVPVVEGALLYADRVFVIDDHCPEESGAAVAAAIRDPRVTVVRNAQNLGVGGAVMAGYARAQAEGCDIVVKMDGDGQMDHSLIPLLIRPIVDGRADYVKGNRFFDRLYLTGMPIVRLLGNSALSFVNKVASGYWNIMDPTNGFTAIHHAALSLLPLDRIAPSYFFESDMLFRLGTIRAVVKDVPMPACYGEEQSSLRIRRVLREFPRRYLANFGKRLLYNYVIRDFNVGTIEGLVGSICLGFGIVFGIVKWSEWAAAGQAAPTGTVMLAALPVILGVQFLIAAVSFDVANVPSEPLQGSRPRELPMPARSREAEVVSLSGWHATAGAQPPAVAREGRTPGENT